MHFIAAAGGVTLVVSCAFAARARARSPLVRADASFETVWTGPQRPLVDGCGGVAASVDAKLAGICGLLESEH